MTDILDQMLQEAKDAMAHAYAPYSNFQVGACLRSIDDQLFSGCNVENASYGLTLCAEAVAIATMCSAGLYTIRDILIISSSYDPCTPCGGCRQRIAEFAKQDSLIYCCNAKGIQLQQTMEELLPHSFGPQCLNL